MVHDWYKDAVFYEVQVRTYADSNGDGKGDLRGLIGKLDYIRALGVDVIWMLPISPSPLRDDGYDVADYCGIHSDLGTEQDYKELMIEAHKRGLKVLVELVLNHSSDTHAWFQASRDPSHPDHKRFRDWYVWSDNPDKYQGVRIIFTDTEKSNWTYDPLRGQYYWHRFFSHQPDLNYDNPAVQRAMLSVIQYWLDLGTDGFRVDAPPYLFEREGTSCENLPETHAYCKRIRSFVDAWAPGTFLLSEANMWPEDVIEYFGKGDEFHMNFHFPLMPRLFMALARQTRGDIATILQRTPALPDSCQWGTFLRCHDELTLEMVSTEDRAFMWEFYAPQARMRLNMGIRRRLAPLLGNDTKKILLAHSMLLSMGGSPVLYYGDEIGMGDNIYLDDRNGVRTPMQWSSNKNAGFSDAPSEQLFLPLVDDEEFSWKKVNVEAQEAKPDSLLQQIRKLLATRKKFKAFGRGSFIMLTQFPESILAYKRIFGSEAIVVINNLSDQEYLIDPVSMNLPSGMTEILLDSQDPQMLNIPARGFRWFAL